MIQFACPDCGKGIKATDQLAGKRARCPKCRHALVVPTASTSGRTGASPVADLATLAPTTNTPDSDLLSLVGQPNRKAVLGPNNLGAISPKLYDFLTPPQAPDEIGWLGPYRVLKILGSGGMGVVYQAEDLQLKRLVALKVMLPALAASPSNRERSCARPRPPPSWPAIMWSPFSRWVRTATFLFWPCNFCMGKRWKSV